MITPEVLAQVRRLTIRSRRAVEEVFAGSYKSAFRGRGLEFAEVREYVPGDDVRAIDWNVTARHGHPFVKRFDEERELTVVVALDLSGSLQFGSRARTKRETAAEAGALLALAASRNRDRVGLLLFTDRIELFLPPSKSRARSLRIVRELVAFTPRGSGTDLSQALTFLGRVLRRRAVLFVISDWLTESFEHPLTLLARRHEIVAIEVSDPLEDALPARGLLRVRDLETGEARVVDLGSGPARREWRAARASRARALSDALFRARADRIRVRCGAPVAPELVRHFEQRTFRALIAVLPRLQRLSAPILAAAVITSFAGCGRGGAPEAKRVLEREETVAGVPVRLRSELQPSRGTLGDPLAWRLSAQLGPGMKAESLRVAPAPAGLDLEEPRDRAAPAGTKRAVFTRELRVRGFDLGPITLPAATLWVRSRARRDTLEFPRDTLFVDSLTPAASGSIRPDRGPIEPALRPLDYAVLILVLALAAGLVFVLARALLRARRTRSAPAPAPPPVPPEETLRAALDELERELGTLPRDIFYERLSLALRAYAAAVAGAPALDYTTTELERDLAAREGVAPEGRRLLIETLRRADLAKFARYEDAESDARSILRAARDISGILVSPRPPDPAPGSRG